MTPSAHHTSVLTLFSCGGSSSSIVEVCAPAPSCQHNNGGLWGDGQDMCQITTILCLTCISRLFESSIMPLLVLHVMGCFPVHEERPCSFRRCPSAWIPFLIRGHSDSFKCFSLVETLHPLASERTRGRSIFRLIVGYIINNNLLSGL